MIKTLSKNAILNTIFIFEVATTLLPSKIHQSLLFTLYLSPITSIAKDSPDEVTIVTSSYKVS
jgi:hypothetical protein